MFKNSVIVYACESEIRKMCEVTPFLKSAHIAMTVYIFSMLSRDSESTFVIYSSKVNKSPDDRECPACFCLNSC